MKNTLYLSFIKESAKTPLDYLLDSIYTEIRLTAQRRNIRVKPQTVELREFITNFINNKPKAEDILLRELTSIYNLDIEDAKIITALVKTKQEQLEKEGWV